MTGALYITRGLPGCGKTTRARAWVAEFPGSRVRVNRDDLRDMLFGGWTGDPQHEGAVTAVTEAMVRTLLRRGWHVVCDDTNLRHAYVERQCQLAVEVGVPVEIWDWLDVPVEVCIGRDAERARQGGKSVGADVIRRMHLAYLAEYAPPLRSPDGAR